MKSVLVNAANLNQGGAIQVAASFISELSKIFDNNHISFYIWVSKAVDANLSQDVKSSREFEEYRVVTDKDFFGRVSYPKHAPFDVCFSVFGPHYFGLKAKRHVAGFAQPWILNPQNEVAPRWSLLKRAMIRLKYSLQKSFFKRYDHLVVELPHVRNRLAELGFEPDRITVVRNCVSAVYNCPSTWQPILNDALARKDYSLVIGYIGRNYPHKNVAIVDKVAEILKSKGERFKILLTLTRAELESLKLNHLDVIVALGELNVNQCPSFYKALDIVLFPSFLECFSATPIEAMFMGRKLIASDRGFVRDVCGDYPIYFEPSSEESLVSALEVAVNEVKSGAISTPEPYENSPRQRAVEYLELIESLF